MINQRISGNILPPTESPRQLSKSIGKRISENNVQLVYTDFSKVLRNNGFKETLACSKEITNTKENRGKEKTKRISVFCLAVLELKRVCITKTQVNLSSLM